jgi:hypothetical protein
MVRTTVNLDEDVAAAARAIARQEQRSLGQVISELARRGLAPRIDAIDERNGFPVFQVEPDAPPITDEMVRNALDAS